MQDKYAVVLFTYRKYEYLEEIIDQIVKYTPSKLYIYQNHRNKLSELFRVRKVKKTLAKYNFNFPVEINYQKTHKKINEQINYGLNHAFSQEEALIILEDDTVPSNSFFEFCSNMLNQFINDEDIGCINGCNLGAIHVEESYFHSNLSVPYWGWATWKSRWLINKMDNYYWDKRKGKILESIHSQHRSFFENCFNHNANGFNVWDVQWNLSLISNNFKTIVSGVNLITNKGFGHYSISMKHTDSKFKDLNKYDFVNTHNYIKLCDESIVFNYENSIVKLIDEVRANLNEKNKKNLR